MAIKALCVGVSDYSAMGESNLPFCINDIVQITDALVRGLRAYKSHVSYCGNNGNVTTSDFIDSLKKIVLQTSEEDTFIFYFSGHGGNLSTGHHLLLSDGLIKTQEIINNMDTIPAKTKIMIIDSCMSGNFKVDQSITFDETTDIKEFIGKGYAVISSSNETQYSWGHPDKPVSLFTSFLCDAMKDRHIVRKGKKSLNDIVRLLSLYLSVWNKRNPKKQQHPIFRANMGGTILFEVENYIPYHVENFHEETDKYFIVDVKPLHNIIAKRYALKIILKEPFSFEEIAQINNEIVNKVQTVEIYENDKLKAHWIGEPPNIVFCYYGRDEFDMSNCNYLCQTTWVDEYQDKKWWYRLNQNCEIINNVHFNIHSYYESLRIFQTENTGEKNNLISSTKEIIKNLILLAEKVITLYNEYLNETKTEQKLVNDMKPIIPLIEKWFFKETNLDIPPMEIKNWAQSCSGLACTIHEFTLFYNERYLLGRNYENRIDCMNMTIQRYYQDLEKVKNEERSIQK
jgi:hypothetical protein